MRLYMMVCHHPSHHLYQSKHNTNGTALLLGTLSSLKNVKKDVTEMRKGTECGMSFEDWAEFKVGDLVQTYEEILEKRAL